MLFPSTFSFTFKYYENLWTYKFDFLLNENNPYVKFETSTKIIGL